MSSKKNHSPTAWAQTLGYNGLMPFIGLSLATWLLPPINRSTALTALLAYAASILSFLGAIHWGFAMREASAPPTRQLVWGVMPSLTAWVALLLPLASGLWLLAAGLWSCWLVDRAVYPQLGLRGWLPMRLLLTVVASLCCIAAAWSTSP